MNQTETTKKPSGSGPSKTLLHLFIIFFKAGTFTFAGGLAMLPVIEKDIVEKYNMMSKDEFMEYATLSQTLPGVIALNCACFVGKRAGGFPGMLAAGIGSTFSAFLLMILATIAIQYIPETGPAMGAMRAVRAASASLILSAAVSLGLHNVKSIYSILVSISAFVLVFILNISTPFVILLAGISGIIYMRQTGIRTDKMGGKEQ